MPGVPEKVGVAGVPKKGSVRGPHGGPGSSRPSQDGTAGTGDAEHAESPCGSHGRVCIHDYPKLKGDSPAAGPGGPEPSTPRCVAPTPRCLLISSNEHLSNYFRCYHFAVVTAFVRKTRSLLPHFTLVSGIPPAAPKLAFPSVSICGPVSAHLNFNLSDLLSFSPFLTDFSFVFSFTESGRLCLLKRSRAYLSFLLRGRDVLAPVSGHPAWPLFALSRCGACVRCLLLRRRSSCFQSSHSDHVLKGTFALLCFSLAASGTSPLPGPGGNPSATLFGHPS